MASIGANIWGFVVTLNHDETQELSNADDVGLILASLLSVAFPAAPEAPGVSAVLVAYISIEKGVMLAADKGNGVYLTVPWPAVALGQWWLIIPTTRPPTQTSAPGAITVRRSTGANFGASSQANENWSHGPCFGSRGTFFADVDGDGKAECILVNDDTITVRRSTGHDFGPGPQANEDWSHGPCFGSRGTFFADVTGDGKADCILVNDDTITVRRSTGHDFGPGPQANENWSHGPCFGKLGTFFADVDGDGRAECILVNDDTITVRRSTGHDFGPGPHANENWSHGPCFGKRGTFFADVDGDGKADCILVNEDTTTVRRSTGHDFGGGPQANEDWSHGPCLGNLGTFFVDVTGEGRADCVLVNAAIQHGVAKSGTVTVRRSTGHDFGAGPQANEDWTHGPYIGKKGSFFADVTGDGRADAIVVNG